MEGGEVSVVPVNEQLAVLRSEIDGQRVQARRSHLAAHDRVLAEAMAAGPGLLLSPVRLVTWTPDQILRAAEAQWYDERAITAALARLNDDYDRGVIDQDTFEAAEDELTERLEAARIRGLERP